jgi:hypothetical protein
LPSWPVRMPSSAANRLLTGFRLCGMALEPPLPLRSTAFVQAAHAD